jgi:hypothetical protein
MATVIVDEIRALGEFGSQALGLLVHVTENEVRRFPALRDDRTMTGEDYALEFFTTRGKEFTVSAITQADSDEALRRMMHSWVKHWLDDENDKTAFGRVRQLLVKRLERGESFWQGPLKHYWGLVDGPHEPVAPDPDCLTKAARWRPITMAPADPKAKRRPNIGKTGELEALLVTVLSTAGGCVHVSNLAQVLISRLPNLLDPLTVYPDSDDEGAGWDRLLVDTDPSEDAAAPGAEALARSIFTTLSDDEKSLIPVIDKPTAAQAFLGLGRSQTALRIKGIKTKLVEMSGGDTEIGRETVRLLIGMCDGQPFSPDGQYVVPLTEGGGQVS